MAGKPTHFPIFDLLPFATELSAGSLKLDGNGKNEKKKFGKGNVKNKKKERQKPNAGFPRCFQKGRHPKFKSKRLSETKEISFAFFHFVFASST